MKLRRIQGTDCLFRCQHFILLAWFLILIPSQVTPAYTQEDTPIILLSEVVFSGKAVSVPSGDTLEVKSDGEIRKVRIANCDAPENWQAYSTTAREFLSKLVSGKSVTVHARIYDWSGQKGSCGRVIMDKTDIGTRMIESGLTWYCEKPLSDNVLRALESEARSAQKGLWQEPNPVPPWKFRGAQECFEEAKP